MGKRKNLGGQKRGRKKTKLGKRVTFNLSNHAIAILGKIPLGQHSNHVESLIIKYHEAKKQETALPREIEEVISRTPTEEGFS